MVVHKVPVEPGTHNAHAKRQPNLSAHAKGWHSYFKDGLRLMDKVVMENPQGIEREKMLVEAHWSLAVSLKKGATDHKIFERLGDVEYVLGLWDAALENYSIAYDFEQGNARVCFMLGEVHKAFAMGSDYKRNMGEADYHYYWADVFYARALELDNHNEIYAQRYVDLYRKRDSFSATGKGFTVN